MKKIFGMLCGFLLVTHIAVAQETATTFVNQLVNDVVKNVLTADVGKEKKTALFETYIVENVDIEAIARTSLAQYWRNASVEEREKFIAAFKEMLMKMSAERFGMYTGQDVKFFAERPAQGKNQVFVDSTISGDPTPIQVVWRVRGTAGDYKVIDIIVEGVSMALSYRNEYTAYLQSHTMDQLIEQLHYQANHAAQIREQEKKTETAQKKK